jgi:hypothetical protein
MRCQVVGDEILGTPIDLGDEVTRPFPSPSGRIARPLGVADEGARTGGGGNGEMQ